ncbi:hypothetical protein GGR51DRAFT_531530 [Nemania sp. FL0031]|nr:hypothetical protein GGR51DRAFT_531530 [Nemania sp. FL0031]
MLANANHRSISLSQPTNGELSGFHGVYDAGARAGTTAGSSMQVYYLPRACLIGIATLGLPGVSIRCIGSYSICFVRCHEPMRVFESMHRSYCIRHVLRNLPNGLLTYEWSFPRTFGSGFIQRILFLIVFFLVNFYIPKLRLGPQGVDDFNSLEYTQPHRCASFDTLLLLLCAQRWFRPVVSPRLDRRPDLQDLYILILLSLVLLLLFASPGIRRCIEWDVVEKQRPESPIC